MTSLIRCPAGRRARTVTLTQKGRWAAAGHPRMSGVCSACHARVEYAGQWVDPGTDTRHACRLVRVA